MKAVFEIIMAVIFMVGVVFTSNFVLHEMKAETLAKVHKGLSPIGRF